MASILSDVDLLSRLIGFDTTSRNANDGLLRFLIDYLERVAERTWSYRDPATGKMELILQRGPAADGPGLILSGHVDTVPADEDGWQSDPFLLTDCGDRLVGRGAADMKGFVALAANLFRVMPAEQLAAPLTLMLTSDEEVGSLGAQRLVKNWDRPFPLPANAIIGEPTGLRLVRMHKGHLKLRVRVRGKGGHSGYPATTDNAIHKVAPVLTLVCDLAKSMETERCETSECFPDCPYPVLSVGTIRGGTAINVVPDVCELQLGIRLLPGQDSKQMLARLDEKIANLPATIRKTTTVDLINDSPPMLCDKHAPANIELARELRQCATIGVSFASDAGTLQQLGINCVLFGPGRIEDAHQPNEFIEKSQLAAGREWITRMIRRFCAAD